MTGDEARHNLLEYFVRTNREMVSLRKQISVSKSLVLKARAMLAQPDPIILDRDATYR